MLDLKLKELAKLEDYDINDEDSENQTGNIEFGDDFDDIFNANEFKMEETNNKEMKEMDTAQMPPKKKQKLMKSRDENETETDYNEKKSSSYVCENEEISEMPENFANVQFKDMCNITNEELKNIFAKYPKFEEIYENGDNSMYQRQEFTVKEGEMFYLPVGWFHEVISFSNKDLKSHMALNYWFHPMTNNATREYPYCDDYWKERFQSIVSKHDLKL